MEREMEREKERERKRERESDLAPGCGLWSNVFDCRNGAKKLSCPVEKSTSMFLCRAWATCGRAVGTRPLLRCFSSGAAPASGDAPPPAAVRAGVPEYRLPESPYVGHIPSTSSRSVVTEEQKALAERDAEYAALLSRARPQFMYGRWRKPKVSARRVAEIRKAALEQGEPWVDPRAPKVYKPRHPLARVGPKGHKHEKLKEKRLENIAEQLKKMPKMIADYRKEQRDRRATRKGVEILFPFRLNRRRRNN
eukprot:TRINITY_DN2055_c4_g2_i1.p2 TRINITY_DN2055_c4_g2~~TRINITY_DN2055_c4_g2_i1.p2  ORF type:complete len:251 (-),score=59.32 TRINITY_DN2055_c4_g2_i1:89-841(-)